MCTKETEKLTIAKLLVSYDKKLLKEYHTWYKEMMAVHNLTYEMLKFNPDNKHVMAMAKRAIKYQGGSVKLANNRSDYESLKAVIDNKEVLEMGTLKSFNFNDSVTEDLEIEVRNICMAIAFAAVMVLYKYNDETFEKAMKTSIKFIDEVIDQTGLLHFLKEGELRGEEAVKFKHGLISWFLTTCIKLGLALMARLGEFSPKAYPMYLLPGFHANIPCLILYFVKEK